MLGENYSKMVLIILITLGVRMDFDEFKRKIKAAIPVDTIMDNPGGGTSTIISVSDDKISYMRGSSTIYVSFQDIYDAYSKYRGQKVTSSDLKVYRPSVFDPAAKPAGHSCNCTFLFLLISRIGEANGIQGAGVRGNPYFVEVAG